ncbi:MAG: T9SS type A sorting domain-containing protein [Flavobacteriaceae bacterium]|nr:T9SS type A sorting domain-containing protein [Flavobacteriaceae bacterium]
MNKLLPTIIAVLAINFSFSQFNTHSPWIQQLEQETSTSELLQRNPNQPFTFFEVQQAFNEYWETRDPSKKGSGYKPFKRWEFMVENEIDNNGYLPSAKTLVDAWTTKTQMHLASKAAMADLSNWSPIGPFKTIGTGSWSTGQARINVVMIDPNNTANGTNIWYAGAPAGGIWKTIDAGTNWTPMSDDLPQMGVSGIAIDHNDSNTIYIATGDDDAGDTTSVGVWKSTNGGVNWSETDLGPNGTNGTPSSMNDIYTHPTISGTLWVATNDGIHKSINGGTSWTKTQTGDFKDLKLNPGNPDILYAATSNRFYRSDDGGDSFDWVANSGFGALPSSSGRLVIDVTPADSDYVYVFRESGGAASIYRSTNSGLSFSARTTTITQGATTFSAGQAWYDLAMGVSSTNAEEIYVGCLNVWKSTNGGTSFTKINNWSSPNGASYTHADIHFLRDYNGTMYCGSDGGIYSSNDGGTNFTNHTFGIQASQYYRVAVAKTDANKMVGGLQDNGGHAFTDTSGQSQNYYGADGMDTAIDPTNSCLFYGFIQSGGGPYISTDGGASLSSSVTAPESGNWVTPMAISSTGTLYGGYSKLFRLDGATWTELANLGGNCDYLEIAPSDDTIIYAVVNNVLKRSTNSGATFTNVGSARPSNIKGIGIHQTNPNIVWLTTSGNSRKVYKTTNAQNGGAATYSDITGNLSGINQYFNDIVHQGNHTDNPLFIATSLGVYRLDDTSATWDTFVVSLPNTIVNDLEINLIDESITAATYGRGVWRSPLPIQMAANDIKLISITKPDNTIVACGSVTPEINVRNNGLNPISQISITYTVDAGVPQLFNWNGTLLSTDETTIVLPTLNLSSSSHVLTVNTTIAGDTSLFNNDSSISFYINAGGIVNNTNSFEAITDELVVYNNTLASGGCNTPQPNIWERGIPTGPLLNSAASGTQVYGTNLNADYPNNSRAFLVSNCYDLTQLVNPTLRFDMAFDLEGNWDIAYTEYSTDQGQNWTVLGTINSLPLWYNSDRTNASSGAADDCQNCPGSQWTGEGENAHASSGTNATMREYAYDFATNAAIGETDLTGATNIMFRIVLHTDGSVTEEGVIIDDFVIDGTLGIEDIQNGGFVIYPNPSKGLFNIVFKNESSSVKFSVYDVTGKIVYSKQTKQFSNKHELNLNTLSTGVYFLEIENDNKVTTKKLVIN